MDTRWYFCVGNLTTKTHTRPGARALFLPPYATHTNIYTEREREEK